MTDFSRWFPIDIVLTGFRNAKFRYPVDDPPFEPGGGSLIHQETVTLTDAQIKSLGNGTAIQIVAAQGANKVIRLVDASAVLDTSAGEYDGGFDPAGSGWAFFLDYQASTYASSVIPIAAPLNLQAITPLLWSAVVSGDSDMVGEGDFAGLIISKLPTTTPVNKALELSDWFAAGAYTGGHASNTLKVSVAYLIWDVSTGAYV